MPDYASALPLFPGATETPGGEVDVWVAPTGNQYRVPRGFARSAEGRGFQPVSPEYLSQQNRRHQALDEQAGFLPAVRTGLESALGTVTFGATYWLLRKATKTLGGVTDEEYDQLRADRMMGSPNAAAIGTAVGIALPALVTVGGGAAAQAARAGVTATEAGAAGAAGVSALEAGSLSVRGLAAATPVGAVMKLGQVATTALESQGAKLATRLLGEGAAVTEAGTLAIEAGTAAAQASRAAMITAQTLINVAPRAIGGAVEGALWGAGEGLREQFNGSTQTLAESALAHMGTDALLFGSLNGTLGVLETALPAALSGAKALVSTAYERAPLFGRRALIDAAVAAPEKTGVAAETARMLYAERELVTQFDQRLTGALDQLARTTPERAEQILARVDDVVAAAAGQRDPTRVLAAIVSAPAEQAELVLGALPGVTELMSVSRTALPDLVAAPPETLSAILGSAEAVAQIERQSPGALRSLLAAPAETAQAAVSNWEGLLTLDAASPGALRKLLAAPTERSTVALLNAGTLAELEGVRRGVLDAILEAPVDRSLAALRNPAGLLDLERAVKNATREILGAEAGAADSLLLHAGDVAALELQARGTLSRLLDVEPVRASLFARNADGLRALERSKRGVVRDLLDNATHEEAEFFASNSRMIAEFEFNAPGVIDVMRESSKQQGEWFLSRSVDIAAMERELPGSIKTFRAFVRDGAWSQREADSLLDNWQAIMRNPNERQEIAAKFLETKQKQYEAGQKLSTELYTAAQAERREILRAIGEPGGPPSLELVQQELNAFSRELSKVVRKMEKDPLSYSSGLVNELKAIQSELRKDFRLPKSAAADEVAAELGTAAGVEAGATARAELRAELEATAGAAEPMQAEVAQALSQAEEIRRPVWWPRASDVDAEIKQPLFMNPEAAQRAFDRFMARPAQAAPVSLADAAEEYFARTAKAEAEAAAKTPKLSIYMRDPFEGFERLSKVRTAIGEIKRSIEGMPGRLPSQNRVLQQVSAVYDSASMLLKDPTVFGEAAKVRAELDQVVAKWRELFEPASDLRTKLMKKGKVEGQRGAVFKFDEPKLNQWINQVGDVRGMAATKAMHKMTSVLEEMIDVGTRAVPSIARGAVEIGEADLRALVERATSAHIDIERRALYSRLYNQTRLNMSESIPNTLGFRRGSVNLGGYGHGAPTAGTSGATVAPSATGTYAEAMALREAGLSRAAAERQTAAELESVRAREGMMQQEMRERELARRSGMVEGRPASLDMEADAIAAQALPGAEQFFSAMTQQAASLVPGGAAVTGAWKWLSAVPRAQWQVTSRVRGMVAIEKRAAELGKRIENGAKSLLSTTRKAVPLIAQAGTDEGLGPRLTQRERAAMQREKAKEERAAMAAEMRRVKELAMDQEVMVKHMAAQGSLVSGDLPDFAEGMNIKAAEAAAVLSESVPEIPEGQLDDWEPSGAEMSEYKRRKDALNNPAGLLARAGNGTLTASEVRAVERVFPEVMEKMRVAVQSSLTDALASGQPIPRQRVQGIEALLGYRLTSASSQTAMAKAQEVFAGGAQAAAEQTQTVRPLPGASRLTLASRAATSMQASERNSA